MHACRNSAAQNNSAHRRRHWRTVIMAWCVRQYVCVGGGHGICAMSERGRGLPLDLALALCLCHQLRWALAACVGHGACEHACWHTNSCIPPFSQSQTYRSLTCLPLTCSLSRG